MEKKWNCACCGSEVKESHPREVIGLDVYCGDCAFKLGLITGEEYIKNYLYYLRAVDLRAAVHNGEIYVVADKFPWEKTPKEMRNSAEYIAWRSKVFERDGFKCVICGQVGGTLNAHHIRSFKKYPNLRLVVDNGVTLCEGCHKRVHKEKDGDWIKEES